jgi:cell division protein FtsZ
MARSGEPEAAPAPAPAPFAAPEPAPEPAPVAAFEPAAPTAEPLSLEPEPTEAEPLELQLDAVAEPEVAAAAEPEPEPEQGDELLLDASRLAAEDEPASPLLGRRRPLVSEPEERTPRLSGGGSTLFERMANLSRGGGRKDDESDDDGDGPSISIPRFLGRQNNQ